MWGQDISVPSIGQEKATVIVLVDQFGLKGSLEFRFNDDGTRVIAVEVPEESKRERELELRIRGDIN